MGVKQEKNIIPAKLGTVFLKKTRKYFYLFLMLIFIIFLDKIV